MQPHREHCLVVAAAPAAALGGTAPPSPRVHHRHPHHLDTGASGPDAAVAVPAAAGAVQPDAAAAAVVAVGPFTPGKGGAAAAAPTAAAAGTAAAGPGPPSSAAAADGGAIGGGPRSVYDLHSERRRRVILAAVAAASVLVPFTDTIYLPALQSVGRDLSAGASLVAASVSIYMAAVGLGGLCWGPLSDRFGRRSVYAASTLLFLGTTLGCIWAPNIGGLVALRALQGWAVAAYSTTASGVIADVFPPRSRGAALGLMMVPLLVGPLLGPLLGGVLSQRFGWRATFVCLAAFGGAVAALLAAAVPETHQRRAVRRLARADPAAAAALAEAGAILSHRLALQGPWVPLRYLLLPDVAPFALATVTSFGSMFASLVAWPGAMAAPPYSLGEAMVGVSFLAMGVAGLVGSPLGGRASDYAAARWPAVPEARLLFGTAASAVLMPAGLLLLGWSLQRRAAIALPLAGHFVVGVASAAWLPGVFAFITVRLQARAGAAAAGVHAAMFFSAAALISASVAGVAAVGPGPYFSALAGAHALAAAGAGAAIWLKMRRAATVDEAAAAAGAVADAGGTKGGEGGGLPPPSPRSRMCAANSRVQLLSAEDESWGRRPGDSVAEHV